MGLHPRIAKYLPEKLVRFCFGLRYPHAFVFCIPVFIIGLLLNDHFAYSRQILTGLGVALFYFSKARWD